MTLVLPAPGLPRNTGAILGRELTHHRLAERDAAPYAHLAFLDGCFVNDENVLQGALRNNGLFGHDDYLATISLKVDCHEHAWLEPAVVVRNNRTNLHRSRYRVQPGVDAVHGSMTVDEIRALVSETQR